MTSNASARSEQTDTPAKPTERRFGPCSPANLLSFLYERTDNFDVDELKFLSGAAEVARFSAAQLGDSISSIGCLIDWDYKPGELRCGNFEDGGNVARLLFTIADQVKVISELAHIGAEASFNLRYMGVRDV